MPLEKNELGWDEFWAELFRVRHRRSLQGIAEYDKMVVDFCIQVLDLKQNQFILDIACGAGDHSILFSKNGLKVTGFDLAQSLVDVAISRAKEEEIEVTFYKGDMRDLTFSENFHAAVLLSHSFGFFDHEENKAVLEKSHEALVDGGRLLLDLINPYNVPRFAKTWTELEGGYLLSEPHMLDAQAGMLKGRPATFIDIEDSRLVLMNQDALSNNDIRMYTALEIKELLEDVGFKKIEFYGQNKLPRMPYSRDSERMVVVATK
ncbi:MAG: class I SAM-dependent methyltransferase [Candidatus Thorarchaeota archaeon]|nr:MAG: class I SAM-dependent methyltransferase [Candidatus Thorarchaeota archaeon]